MANAHITTRVEFLTSILTAWDGSEQRQALRREPRRFASYDYSGMDAKQSAHLRALRNSPPNTVIKQPMWHCSIPKLNDFDKLNPDYDKIYIPKEYLWCFRNIGRVWLWEGDPAGAIEYGIRRLTREGLLEVRNTARIEWRKDTTTLYPLVSAILPDSGTFTARNDDVSELTLELELLQDQNTTYVLPHEYGESTDEEVASIWGFTKELPATWENAEVWRYEPQWEGNIDVELDKHANRIDYTAGTFKYDVKNPSPSETREVDYVLHGRALINNLERFFYRHMGRLKSFYAPTWLTDVELTEDALQGTALIKAKIPLYWKYYKKSARRKTLCVFFKNRPPFIFYISEYIKGDNVDFGSILLDEPLPIDLMVNEVVKICFFNRYRFDSDSLTIDYETNDTATTSITFREVDEV